MSDFEIVPYRADLFGAYSAFAERAWGGGAYQSTATYLDWLYGGDPSGVRYDFLLATSGVKVIGCIHKLRLPWKGAGESADVPALHNWIVEEDARSGVGLVLLTKALRSEQHAFVSSAAGELATIYRKLRCEQIDASWYRRILRPVAGGMRLAASRASGRSWPWLDLARRIERLCGERGGDVAVASSLSDREVEDVVAHIDRLAADRWHPAWTPHAFRWRFFHPRGPRHVSIALTAAPEERLIVSLGVQGGLATARVVESLVSSPSGARTLFDGAAAALARAGFHVLLNYCAHPVVNAHLRDAGWRPYRAQPSFIGHGRKARAFSRVAFHGSAGDFGFEAFESSRG